MNSQVEQVMKNTRYRIIIQEDNYYILDVDQGIWTFFIPFLF